MGDTASVFINLLILLSYSANFFIYCAMSAQFRAALFDTFSRRHATDLNTTTAALDPVSRAAGRRSTAATSLLPTANWISAAKQPDNLMAPAESNSDHAGTGTRPPTIAAP